MIKNKIVLTYKVVRIDDDALNPYEEYYECKTLDGAQQWIAEIYNAMSTEELIDAPMFRAIPHTTVYIKGEELKK